MKKVMRTLPRRETVIYSDEFKAKAVAKWRDQKRLPKKSQREVADELGVSQETFRRWCQGGRKGKTNVLTQANRLETEIDRLYFLVDKLAAMLKIDRRKAGL